METTPRIKRPARRRVVVLSVLWGGGGGLDRDKVTERKGTQRNILFIQCDFILLFCYLFLFFLLVKPQASGQQSLTRNNYTDLGGQYL